MAREYDHIIASDNNNLVLVSGWDAAFTYRYLLLKKSNVLRIASARPTLVINSSTSISMTRLADRFSALADSDSTVAATSYDAGNISSESTGYPTITVVDNYLLCFTTEDDAITVFLFNTKRGSKSISDVAEGDYYIAYTDSSGASRKVKIGTKVAANYVYYKVLGLDIDFTQAITVTRETLPEMTLTNNVDNTTAEGTVTGENSGSVTLNAADGYKIDSAAVSYMNTDGYATSANLQIAEDGLSATWTGTDIDFSTALTLSGTASPVSTEPTFTNNIPNSTYSYSGSNHQYVVNLQADNGYIFDGTPEATYTGYSSDTPVSVSFAVSSDKKTASAVCPDVDENTPIVLSGSTTEEVTVTVVNNIDGTTETHSFDGTTFAITVTGSAGHKRFKNPQLAYTDSDGNEQTADMSVSLVDNVPTAIATLTDVENASTVNVNGSFEYATYIYESLSNCSLSESLPEYVFKGDSVTVNLTANENTLFESSPVFEYFDSGSFPVSQEMIVSADKKTVQGTITIPSDYDLQTLTVNATATPQTIVGENYGAINVYKVDKDSLQAFSRKRFFKETSTDGTVTAINLGDYVNRIKRVFLDVPTIADDVIKCGNYNTGVPCYAPEADIITIDFGSILLPTPNGDNTDYESDYQLFLPFKGFVSIPISFAGKTVALSYDVNIITGGGVAKLKIDDEIIQVEDVEPSEDVLYRTASETVNLIGGEKWNEAVLYGLTPFVRVMYYNSMNTDGINNDCKTVDLADLSGYNAVENVDLSTTPAMTISEQESILKQLRDGVYFE